MVVIVRFINHKPPFSSYNDNKGKQRRDTKKKTMNTKMILLILAVFVLGIFALSSTPSLFSGQHSWYNLSGGGNDVPCEKCHADIAEEYQDASAHPLYAPHKTYPCSLCHRISGFGENNGTQMTYASGDGSTPGKQTHAAVTVECMDCHDMNFYGEPLNTSTMTHHAFNLQYQTCGLDGAPEGPGNCHAPPRGGWGIKMIRAGGFGITDFNNMSGYYHKPGVSWHEDTGSKAAHRQFVLDAIKNTTLEGANEACIACHTKLQVKMQFNVTTGVKITVNKTYTQSSSYWNVTEIEPGNYIIYEEVKDG